MDRKKRVAAPPGNRVRVWRDRARLSREEAAQLLDVSVVEYDRLERGEADARSRGVRELQRTASLTLREIVGHARVSEIELDDITGEES